MDATAPRWIEWTARAASLTALPSGVWRVALGFGVPVGFSGDLADLYRPGWPLTPYVIVLSLLTESLAMLTMGLVRPWGEVVPSWIPWLGGRRVPPLAAVVPASLGALAVTAITLLGAVSWTAPDAMGDPDAPHGLAGAVMTACYAPLLAWGPLLAVVTTAYYLRRTRGTRPTEATA
ncbi:hypothetical protein DZF91_22210 [Actinomadura logoneensis]|uniref:Uncharacterized protein n=1 Tax=Actinomadura logoneensis TaxID=2293572 RepID=A0A372JHJ5_9ACTN|nr:hypothetical protein [Actinomadura logoneensis]RFU39473.1 hypothetical protein DZF91_22210 [Actinomadura logoneensis]